MPGDTLESVAKKYNLSVEILVQYNESYKNRLDLTDCPIMIPLDDEEDENNNMRKGALDMNVLLPWNKEPRLEPLIGSFVEYSYIIKELVITKYSMPNYTPILYKISESKKGDITKLLSKEKSKDPLAISQAQEYKDFASTILLLVTAIKSHGLDDVKKELGNLKNWYKKVIILYQEPKMRDDKLKNTLQEVSEKWRDYVIKVGAELYNEAENLFKDIIDKVKDIAKLIVSKN